MNLQVAASSIEAPDEKINRAEADWYKDALIYQVHVKAFADSTGDGIGDFAGLIERLDYIQELGVTAIWLMPFYPSPLRDDGYDISDYWTINSAYGQMEMLERFVTEAHRRGMRVITELVINHTSDQHPWFQRARNSPAGTPERDYYVWSDTDQKYLETRIIFIDTEPSNWTWDPAARAYFWHRFYSHQPDLNYDNPQVLQEVLNVLYFWLDKGIDGLRLDAIPYLVEREGTNNENLPETHDVLKKIRAALDAHYSDRMLLAEANQWPEDTRPYFGEGDECHMAFHFPLMPRMYMALAQEDRHPITDILRQTPELPEVCQWAIFLRNHDELTLEMVTAEERDYLWRTYANDARARINLGIRRRLAPLLGNDRRKIELMNALLMSMPGTPVIYYGDEIGMGDNYYLGDRDGVRTPMQWSADRNAGFSRADPQRLYLPPIMDAVYGYQAVNVEAQQREPSSLLNWMRRLIAARKQNKAFSRGTLSLLYPRNRKIFAYLREFGEERILCVANLAGSAQACELNLAAYKDAVPVELLGRSTFPPVGTLPYLLTLPGYGFYWFLLTKEAELPRWHTPIPEPLPDFITLVVRDGVEDVLSGRNAQYLANDVLPQFLVRQRWFAAKDTAIRRIEIEQLGQLEGSRHFSLFTLVTASPVDGEAQRYFMPFAANWGEQHLRSDAPMAAYTLAKLRHGSRVGAIYDAVRNEAFVKSLLHHMAERRTIQWRSGELRFTANEKLDEALAGAEDVEVRAIGAEQSNVSLALARRLMLKVYRRAQPGVNPEVEMLRFLTEKTEFRSSPTLLGAAEYFPQGGEPVALAAAFSFLENQGDAWNGILDALTRELQDCALQPCREGEAKGRAKTASYPFPLDLGRTLGHRTAELHAALASSEGDPLFDPEPIRASDMKLWLDRAKEQMLNAYRALERDPGPAQASPAVADLLKVKVEALACLEEIARRKPRGVKMRIHGDYHLGQALIAKTDVHIIDFEGEPGRPVSERREKTSPLRDVAGILRSFDYVAWAAFDRAAALDGEHTEALTRAALAWRDSATADFLKAYVLTARGRRKLDRELLDFFLLHKGFYEIAYEAANRPAWLAIPVRGVLDILRRRGAVQ